MTQFEHEHTPDEATGRSLLTVRLDGEQCTKVSLTGPMARSYVGFSLILKDLEDVLAFIRAAYALLPERKKSADQDTVRFTYSETNADLRHALKAYFYAAIVLYGKCFVSAHQGRGTTLGEKDYVDSALLPTHEKIMRFRHRLVAHGGNEFDEGEALVALPHPSDPRYHVVANTWRLDFEDDRENAHSFEDLIVHVKSNVKEKQNTLLKKLLDGDALAIAKAHRGKK